MRRHLLLVALVLPLAAASECESKPIRFLVPGKNAEVTWMPLTIEIDFPDDADESTFNVLLNGQDVTDRFTLQSPYKRRIVARAELVWDGGVVAPGTNVIDFSVQRPQGLEHKVRQFTALGDPYADDVVAYSVGTDGGWKEGELPGVVTGPPEGAGLFEGAVNEVFSLGLSGSVDLAFTDNVIVDGPGDDFTVFENAFLEDDGFFTVGVFSEPGRVSVSQDGVAWHVFSACQLSLAQAPYHPGCAGVYPVLSNTLPGFPHAVIPTFVPIEDLIGQEVDFLEIPEGAGGDPFDLADVGLAWARYVRIEAAPFVDGPSAPPVAGFDLDAVVARNSVPATDLDENGIPDAVE